METLKDIDLKIEYRSDEDGIINTFYLPCLSVSKEYYRAVGYFTSGGLSVASMGLSAFINNNGKMKLVASPYLTKDDYEAIIKGYSSREETIENKLVSEIKNISDVLKKERLELLAWLLANEKLDIKIAICNEEIFHNKSGLYHEKIGIFIDNEDNIVAFTGSPNETIGGLISNFESIDVYFSWDDSRERVLRKLKNFQNLWDNQTSNLDIYDFPNAAKQELIKFNPSKKPTNEPRRYKFKIREKKKVILRDYQIEAVQKWINNDYKGILEMATGTGKTFTALEAVKKLSDKIKPIAICIVAPLSHLVSQWAEEVESYGLEFDKVIAGGQNPNWKNQLTNNLIDLKNNVIENLIILTTHNTFSNEKFIEIISKFNIQYIIICDEVHGVGAPEFKKGLMDNYQYRIGLSATPTRWFDDEGTETIMKYFEKVVYEFPLKKAINTINPDTGKTYLTKYIYYPMVVELDPNELEEYIEQSKKIAKAYHLSKNNMERSEHFKFLCIKRQKVITNAKNKLLEFEKLISSMEKINNLLVYCSPNQIKDVQQILIKSNIKQHKFTGDEGIKPESRYNGISQRDDLLNKFESGSYQALVSMKCLDQGVDVRSAKTAIFLASSSNPIEFIQRRGRILRQFPGKEKAYIYDILVIPQITDFYDEYVAELEKKIILKELERFKEFADAAENYVECIKILLDIEKRIF